MGKKILFVNHHKKQCGVYEFGNDAFRAISKSVKNQFVLAECDSMAELNKAIKEHTPDVIIYNFHPSTMAWVYSKIGPRLFRSNIAGIGILQIGIMHEVTQKVADEATNYRNKMLPGTRAKLINCLFDFYIAPDPTLLLRNPNVYKTGRLIPEYQNNYPLPSVPVIGSFGFGTPNKGFEDIVTVVQKEFDEAVIRLNIAAADFGDPDGANARKIAGEVKQRVTKKGIQLQVTHDYLDKEGILNFLAQNTVNVFLYRDTGGRGVSSAIDNALTVRRPVAVSGSSMFRHLLSEVPSAEIYKSSIREIIERGFAPYEKLASEWDAATLCWEYERIIDSAFKKYQNPYREKMGIIRTVQSSFRRPLTLPDKSFTWLRDSDVAYDEDLTPTGKGLNYSPVVLPADKSLNRILDNDARSLYKPAIQKLFELAPNTMSKKIPEANVQQAFIFDTVCRLLPGFVNPKMLCVGSYEDTAAMGLIRSGFEVEQIDPMINYFLQEYISKPSVKLHSYDIIFSTSVIEHDPDDESFVQCINDLLAINGIAVITCDFKDGWKPGDLKPGVDARLYTQHDLEHRLLQHMPGCVLIDKPDWNCPEPDFVFLNKYRYTFATFVVRKISIQ